jgi:Spy/CpxP family protein refolding chaperone
MKKINFLSLIFTFWLTVLAFSTVSAQEQTADENQNQQQANRPFRLLQELGLSREQIQQISRINQERRPIMQEAARRWRQANRDLDIAIYADNSTDEQVKELLKTAQLAQTELLKERSLTEYLIRKVLTPEQLVKFRNLRQQLIEKIMI